MMGMNAANTIDQGVAAGKIEAPDAVSDIARAVTVAVLDILNNIAISAQHDPLGGPQRRMEWTKREQIAQNVLTPPIGPRLYHAAPWSANQCCLPRIASRGGHIPRLLCALRVGDGT